MTPREGKQIGARVRDEGTEEDSAEIAGPDNDGPIVKLEFHDADTDTDTAILSRILADTSDARFPEIIPIWQAQRHADIFATILARMSARKSVSVSVSVSAPWNASLTELTRRRRFCPIKS